MKLLNKFKISLPPLPTPPPTHAPQKATLVLLSGLLGVAVFSHFYLGHWAIAVYGLLIWAMKSATIARIGPQPARWLVMLLTIMSFVLVLVFYGGWNGQKAGISFLVLLAALKFLESQSLRDYYLVCLILLFLASSSFLFNSSLPSIFAVLVYTVCIISIMLRLSDPADQLAIAPLKTAMVILAKALPLAVLLFFFFPRIHGDFGFIPSQDKNGSENQLSDALVAGDFATAAFSNEPAFRVEFDGDIPDNRLLYWRAKVMLDERNFAWEVRTPTAEQLRAGRQRPPRLIDENSNPYVAYQIVHEPSEDSFLPYLDYALNPSTGIQLDNMSVYRLSKAAGIFAYNGVATTQPNLFEISKQGLGESRSALLATTSQPSARAQALLQQWRQTAQTETELVELVLGYYRDNNFQYSLTPQSLDDDPVDDFLFEKRNGYCEHYASSFTILMRWLGIPSRVVVGYQGGSRNVIGGYLQVRYSDAHAWSEVWVNGQWRRVDPTTTASLGEQRISEGMSAILSLWEGGLWDQWQGGTSLTNFMNPSGYEKTLQRLRDTWDNVGYQWNKWVINYDFEAQKNLLSKLGFEHRNTLTTLLGLLAISTMTLMLFYFWQLIPKAVRLGEAQQTYLQFTSRLKRFDLIKAPAETPTEFATRAKRQLPALSEQIQIITDHYTQLRYGKQPGDLDEFKRQVKGFRPQRGQ